MNNSKPIHELRIGSIKAAIWENNVGDGTRFNVTFCRLYRDKDTHEWKSTESFGRDDLLLVAKVADQAHTWIHDQKAPKESLPASASPRSPAVPQNPRPSAGPRPRNP